MDFTALPAHELIVEGLDDLNAGRRTSLALLVTIGAERLRRAGVPVPEVEIGNPEHELYLMLAAEHADSAHSRYNALIRQLVSFERAAECAA